MSYPAKEAEARAFWFVGATYGGTEDQSTRFFQDGVWQNGYRDKYLETVKMIGVGDRIAIKASYTRKNGLPFENCGNTVSVMSIKAVGVVTENPGDGRNLKVDWQPLDTPREWYFYTNRNTVWKVLPGQWMTDALIAFTFNETPQDIDPSALNQFNISSLCLFIIFAIFFIGSIFERMVLVTQRSINLPAHPGEM